MVKYESPEARAEREVREGRGCFFTFIGWIVVTAILAVLAIFGSPDKQGVRRLPVSDEVALISLLVGAGMALSIPAIGITYRGELSAYLSTTDVTRRLVALPLILFGIAAVGAAIWLVAFAPPDRPGQARRRSTPAAAAAIAGIGIGAVTGGVRLLTMKRRALIRPSPHATTTTSRAAGKTVPPPLPRISRSSPRVQHHVFVHDVLREKFMRDPRDTIELLASHSAAFLQPLWDQAGQVAPLDERVAAEGLKGYATGAGGGFLNAAVVTLPEPQAETEAFHVGMVVRPRDGIAVYVALELAARPDGSSATAVRRWAENTQQLVPDGWGIDERSIRKLLEIAAT